MNLCPAKKAETSHTVKIILPINLSQVMLGSASLSLDLKGPPMFTIIAVVRKLPEICQEEFRRIWKEEYGPGYKKIPQVKSYKQYHLSDRRKDDTEDPIDGITIMSFESEEEMNAAWKTAAYKEVSEIRAKIMRQTAVGVHVTSVDEVVTIV